MRIRDLQISAANPLLLAECHRILFCWPMVKLLERLSFSNLDPRINRRNLAYFYAAAELSSFTRAAKELGIAQPSLSRGIVLLEDAMGAALFERVGRSIKVSALGKELFPLVELHLNQYVDLTEALSSWGSSGKVEIRVAVVSSLTSDLFPKLINEFEKANDTVKVTLIDGTNSEVVKQAESGSVDLGVCSRVQNPRTFRSKLVLKDRYCLAVGEDHGFVGRRSIRWDELNHDEMVSYHDDSSSLDSVREAMNSIGRHYAPLTRTKYLHTMIGLIRHRGLIAILPEFVLKGSAGLGIQAISLVDPIVFREYYLIERKGRIAKPECAKLAAFMKLALMAEVDSFADRP